MQKSTLAAHAYRGEQSLMDAVLDAAELMPQYIQVTDDGLLVPQPGRARARPSPTAGATSPSSPKALLERR
jgi:hypothetical protein